VKKSRVVGEFEVWWWCGVFGEEVVKFPEILEVVVWCGGLRLRNSTASITSTKKLINSLSVTQKSQSK
jgi:hypothetical protein